MYILYYYFIVNSLTIDYWLKFMQPLEKKNIYEVNICQIELFLFYILIIIIINKKMIE